MGGIDVWRGLSRSLAILKWCYLCYVGIRQTYLVRQPRPPSPTHAHDDDDDAITITSPSALAAATILEGGPSLPLATCSEPLVAIHVSQAAQSRYADGHLRRHDDDASIPAYAAFDQGCDCDLFIPIQPLTIIIISTSRCHESDDDILLVLLQDDTICYWSNHWSITTLFFHHQH